LKKHRIELVERIGDAVDRLITVDVTGRGLIEKLYSAGRNLVGRSLTLTAAEKLREALEPGDCVLFTTGFLLTPRAKLTENDGPLGCAALARALQVGLRAKPIFVLEEELLQMMANTARGAMLNIIPVEHLKGEYWMGKPELEIFASVVPFPIDDEKAKEQARKLMIEYSPKAVIAIERIGPNRKGVYHSGAGFSYTWIAKAGHLFDEAKRRGILTIGIGDFGNEIGFGNIRDKAIKIRPSYSECTCGCGGGVINDTTVDAPVYSVISNWGAYGISACLAALSNNMDVLHNAKIELKMLRVCVDSGAFDGALLRPSLSVDGIPGEMNASLVEMLRQIVINSLKEFIY